MHAPISPARFLACCTAHSLVGCTVTPVMRRRVVPCSRNASAYRRAPSTVSTWKKSVAMMPSGLRVQKLTPGRAASPRCRIDAHAVQDLADRRGAQVMTKPNQLAMDPPMSPPRILPGKPERERPDRSLSWGTPSPPTRGVDPLPGHEPAMPAEQRPRSNRENHLPPRAVHQSRQRGEPEPSEQPATCRPPCTTAKRSPEHARSRENITVQSCDDFPGGTGCRR
jgi:hypothetical protein